MCAERVAVFSAVAAGNQRISAIAVSCIDVSDEMAVSFRMPCGACRQVLMEFADPGFVVIVDGVGEFQLSDLLPFSFKLF